MKNIRGTTLGVLLVSFLFAGTAAIEAGPATANKISYKVDDALVSSGADADAAGRVQVLCKQQGASERDRLRVTVKNLDPNTSYTLLALIGTSETYVAVTNFTTSSSGKGKVLYVQNSAISAASKNTLPPSLDPIMEVRALAIANSSEEIVLSLNLHESLGMTFEMTSLLSSTENDPYAVGCFAVACQYGSVQFRLFAVGSSSEYTLSVNNTPLATYEADGSGRIAVGALPEGAPSPMMFKTIDLRNSGNAVVLEAEVH
jgi:hypothetical protein